MSILDALDGMRTYTSPPATDGLYVKAGVPVSQLPTERQSLPMPSDVSNLSDPLQSATTMEPLKHAKPRASYDPPVHIAPDWATLNARVAGGPRRRGPSERTKRQLNEAEQLHVSLEQRRLDNAALEIKLNALRAPPAIPRGSLRSISSVWPQLAGSRSIEGSSDPYAALVLQATTSAYLPAGLPLNRSAPFSSYAARTSSWGRPAAISQPVSPTMRHTLGIGGRRAP
ncbi:hypothetical protein T492DRAFT_956914 [Pavlovales sp. CCMP2436]|nr:hypothetical protein T492DRAFT_956914 [Pavlovales sp. CCMP2436]